MQGGTPNKDYFGDEFGDQLSSVLSRVVEFITVWKIDLCSILHLSFAHGRTINKSLP